MEMRALIIDNHSNHIEEIRSYLKDRRITVKSYLEIHPEDTEIYDIIILSGGFGRSQVIDEPKVNIAEINLVQETSKPVIGICYGSQIIADAFGGHIEELPEKIIANKEIEFTKDFLGKKPGDRIIVHESHHFAIKTLSPELIGIAKSTEGYEIIRHRTKPIFGFQFHPEIHPELIKGDELFKKLIETL